MSWVTELTLWTRKKKHTVIHKSGFFMWHFMFSCSVLPVASSGQWVIAVGCPWVRVTDVGKLVCCDQADNWPWSTTASPEFFGLREQSIPVIETHRRYSLCFPDKDFDTWISQQRQQKQQAGIAKRWFYGSVLFGLNCCSVSFPPIPTEGNGNERRPRRKSHRLKPEGNSFPFFSDSYHHHSRTHTHALNFKVVSLASAGAQGFPKYAP